MILNLHIERLVIDGLPVAKHEAPVIEASLSAEVTRLLTEGRLHRLDDRRFEPLVRAEQIERPARDAGQLGTQIGRAVHGAIGK